MRCWLPCSAAVLALAACGGDEPARTVASPSPAPPDPSQMKYDLLTAEIQLDAYKLAEGTYTADETQLGPAFPRTVTVKEADAHSFYMAAYDNQRIRYVLRRRGPEVERTCAPADPEECPSGEW
jgi:hypothetical protein